MAYSFLETNKGMFKVDDSTGQVWLLNVGRNGGYYWKEITDREPEPEVKPTAEKEGGRGA